MAGLGEHNRQVCGGSRFALAGLGRGDHDGLEVLVEGREQQAGSQRPICLGCVRLAVEGEQLASLRFARWHKANVSYWKQPQALGQFFVGLDRLVEIVQPESQTECHQQARCESDGDVERLVWGGWT